MKLTLRRESKPTDLRVTLPSHALLSDAVVAGNANITPYFLEILYAYPFELKNDVSDQLGDMFWNLFYVQDTRAMMVKPAGKPGLVDDEAIDDVFQVQYTDLQTKGQKIPVHQFKLDDYVRKKSLLSRPKSHARPIPSVILTLNILMRFSPQFPPKGLLHTERASSVLQLR